MWLVTPSLFVRAGQHWYCEQAGEVLKYVMKDSNNFAQGDASIVTRDCATFFFFAPPQAPTSASNS
jgi:hypothetical protein